MADARPNILIFMPDQLRADALGCFGSPVAHTPNIDALARRGTRFTEAFVNHPVCGPSRVNLMTGWYPHTRGHRTLTHLVQAHEPNLLRYLKDGGYQVAFAGHRGDMFAAGVTEASTHFCGWTTRPARGQMGMGPQHPEHSPLYHAFVHGIRPGVEGVDQANANWLDFDEAATRTAIEWIEKGAGAGGPSGAPSGRPSGAPSGGPWCLFVPLIFPHLPFGVEAHWYALHAGKAMPPPISPSAMRGKPRFMTEVPQRAHLDQLAADEWADIARIYHAMVSRVDEQLGRIVAAVDAIGATASTDVFFFTDHGEYLGDYGMVEKWPSAMDPCITRNPLIVAGPSARAGVTCDAFVEMVDVLPTLLELAGVEAKHTHFGRSFAGLLAGSADALASAREFACTEGGFRREDEHLFERPTGEYQLKGELQHEQPEIVGKAFCLRTKDWSYVWRQYEGEELYSRAEDPQEVVNLLVDPVRAPALAPVTSELREKLLRWLADTSDVIPWEADERFPRIPHGWRL